MTDWTVTAFTIDLEKRISRLNNTLPPNHPKLDVVCSVANFAGYGVY